MSTYLAKRWEELQRLVNFLMHQGIDFNDSQQMERLKEMHETILEINFGSLKQSDIDKLRSVINYVKNGNSNTQKNYNYYQNTILDDETLFKELRKEYMKNFNEKSTVKEIDDLFMSFLNGEHPNSCCNDKYNQQQEINKNYLKNEHNENYNYSRNDSLNNKNSNKKTDLDSLLDDLFNQVQNEYYNKKSIDENKNNYNENKYLNKNEYKNALDSAEKPEPVEFYWPSKKKDSKYDHENDYEYRKRKKEEEKKFNFFDDENPFF
ncbi:MAG: hypothetical protein QXR30_02830 [Candidatus Woesearchaeota archaeon]